MGDGERVGLRTLLSAERDRDLEGERLELHERGWGPGLRDELFPSGPPCRPCTPGDGEMLAGRARGGLSLALREGHGDRALSQGRRRGLSRAGVHAEGVCGGGDVFGVGRRGVCELVTGGSWKG